MKYATIIVVIAVVAFFFHSKKSESPTTSEQNTAAEQPEPIPKTHESAADRDNEQAVAAAKSIAVAQAGTPGPDPAPAPRTTEPVPTTRQFSVEDGVATVDQDIVLGKAPEGKTEGLAQLPELQLWPSHEIPYYVQPSLQNPERIQDAIKLFENTAVTFVPYTDQDDVLVFEEGTGTCKSYVGRIGGKQPVWISPKCGGYEIAHEMMHALGFVHEQNRIDRDQFITVNAQNIEPQYMKNFDRMPDMMMTVSGLEPFDFESIMIYPPNMFSSNRQATMTAKIPNQKIEPLHTLSSSDRKRLNDYYSRR